MANKIVKESESGSANKLMKKFLALNPDSEAGSIRNYLAQHGITYAKNRGFYMRLVSLCRNRVIEKRKPKYSRYPFYRLSTNESNRPWFLGFLLKHKLEQQISYFQNDHDEKEFLKFVSILIGVYTMYVELSSWHVSSSKRSSKARLQARSEFLDGALPINLPMDYTINESTFHLDKIGNEKKFQELSKKLPIYEKEMRELFPPYITYCKDMFEEAFKLA